MRELAESWASRPVVVGTALVHEGRLLAQQRGYPAAHAGRWELPGGRVEPGETESDAVVRECREELDVEVRPTGRLGTDVPLDNGMLLRIHTAELVDAGQVPRAVEHREVRWLTAADLPALDWLDTDRVLLHHLRELLR
nr:NUDIX domain-containing protein [Saccharopolyspora flava]